MLKLGNMKIAIVHDQLNQFGGAEKVVLAISEIYPNAPIFTSVFNGRAKTYFKRKYIITSFLQKLPKFFRFQWFLPLLPISFERFDLKGYDVVITSSASFAKGVLTDINSVHICYCHTPTRFLWTESQEYIDSIDIPNVIKRILPIIISYLRQWDFLAAQRVDKFIANSKFVAERIRKFYKRDAKVIYPPVEIEKFKISEDKGYYLIISRLRPYKKIDIAIEACNELKLPLKIIGEGTEYKKLKKIAGPTIEFLGFVSEKLKIELLSNCKALIYPQEEDFGISAVEALASGKPVIAYKGGGVLEIIKDKVSGIFFEEQTWESLADALVNFNSNEFDSYKLRELSKKFSKEVFKKEIFEFIKKTYEEFKQIII